MLKVILIDNNNESISPLQASLVNSGFDVIAHIKNDVDFPSQCSALSADVVIIDTDSPCKNTLYNVRMLSKAYPKPIVMFSHDDDQAKMREATQAGVNGYVIGNIPNERLAHVIDAAVARFEETQKLKDDLNTANLKLTERKFIERAKGILMHQRNLDEDTAYTMLREIAMKRNMKISDISKQLIDASSMLIV